MSLTLPCVILVPLLPDNSYSCHLCNASQLVKDHNSLIKHIRKKHPGADIIFKCRHCLLNVDSLKRYRAHMPSCVPLQPPSVLAKSPEARQVDSSDENSASGLITVPEVITSSSSAPTRSSVIVTVTDFDMIPNRDLERIISVNESDLIENTIPSVNNMRLCASPASSSDSETASRFSFRDSMGVSDASNTRENAGATIPVSAISETSEERADCAGATIPLSAISEFVAEARRQLDTTDNAVPAQHQAHVAAATEPTDRPAYRARGRTRGWAPNRPRELSRARGPALDMTSRRNDEPDDRHPLLHDRSADRSPVDALPAVRAIGRTVHVVRGRGRRPTVDNGTGRLEHAVWALMAISEMR